MRIRLGEVVPLIALLQSYCGRLVFAGLSQSLAIYAVISNQHALTNVATRVFICPRHPRCDRFKYMPEHAIVESISIMCLSADFRVLADQRDKDLPSV
jgi:hypothetical protein